MILQTGVALPAEQSRGPGHLPAQESMLFQPPAAPPVVRNGAAIHRPSDSGTAGLPRAGACSGPGPGLSGRTSALPRTGYLGKSATSSVARHPWHLSMGRRRRSRWKRLGGRRGRPRGLQRRSQGRRRAAQPGELEGRRIGMGHGAASVQVPTKTGQGMVMSWEVQGRLGRRWPGSGAGE